MLRHMDLNRYKGYNNVSASIKVHGEHLKPTGWTHTDVFKHLLKRYDWLGEGRIWVCCKLLRCNMQMWNYIQTSLNFWKWCMCTNLCIRTCKNEAHHLTFNLFHNKTWNWEGHDQRQNKQQMNHKKRWQKKAYNRIRRRSYIPCSASVARDPDQKSI